MDSRAAAVPVLVSTVVLTERRERLETSVSHVVRTPDHTDTRHTDTP